MLTISRAKEIIGLGNLLTIKAFNKLKAKLKWYKKHKPFHENVKRLKKLTDILNKKNY